MQELVNKLENDMNIIACAYRLYGFTSDSPYVNKIGQFLEHVNLHKNEKRFIRHAQKLLEDTGLRETVSLSIDFIYEFYGL